MKYIAMLILAVMLFAAPANELAVPSGETWLKLVDSGKYADSWREASSYFRSRVPEKDWVRMVRGVRMPLGALVSRYLAIATGAKTLPGAPDGNYQVIQFQTSFENKA